MSISYIVRRGRTLGTVLAPHRHKDGSFVASPERRTSAYERFSTADLAFAYALANGWGIRMSAPGRSQSLIKADRCET